MCLLSLSTLPAPRRNTCQYVYTVYNVADTEGLITIGTMSSRYTFIECCRIRFQRPATSCTPGEATSSSRRVFLFYFILAARAPERCTRSALGVVRKYVFGGYLTLHRHGDEHERGLDRSWIMTVAQFVSKVFAARVSRPEPYKRWRG